VLLIPKTGEKIMETIEDKARARIKVLKSQISELERFLEILSNLKTPKTTTEDDSFEFELPLFGKDEGNVTPQIPVKNSETRQRRLRNKMRPSHVAELMERIIREVDRPMTRSELVEAFEKRDIQIPFADKARYIGTIAWRHKGIFVNIEGEGYWLRREPQKAGENFDLDD
jgi:hypothetical protein